ncbi:MAG: RagB/SusD family nutrient uptake outer membrane protein [Bacteroidales bacterium]|nr:RagB/SusD family nutrient uptake outer membrane protein [Bacteroidales bacterium]
MKNNFFALVAIAGLSFSLSGCSDYLDRTPLDANSDATNWTSEASIQTFAWGLYSVFDAYSYGNGWTRGQYHGEGITDDYNSDSFAPFTQNVPSSSSSWSTPYDYIRRANVMLNRINRVPGLTGAAKAHWRGVARFFRGMEHFELVKTYGDVVWVDTEIDIDDAIALGRSRDDRVTVMKNVCADLKAAADSCYAPGVSGKNTVNSMVANALLARVALFEGSWQKYHAGNTDNAKYFYDIAKTAAGKIISSGLYSINGDYDGLYTSDNLSGRTDVILYDVYSEQSSGGSVNKGNSVYGWDISSSPSWGITKSAIESFANANGLPIYMDTYSDATVEQVIRNRDARLSISVVDTLLCPVGIPFTDGIVSSTGYWVRKYVPWERKDAKEKVATWNAPYNDTDGPIFTYAEVLENYAEAAAELGTVGGTAITQADLDKSVNILRVQHGKIPGFTLVGTTAVAVNGTTITADPKNTTGVSVLLWELRRERRSELICDGFRYRDLMRWKMGNYLDFSTTPDSYKGATLAAIKTYYDAHTTLTGEAKTNDWNHVLSSNFWSPDGYKASYNINSVSRVWDDKYYLEPIPSGQITLDRNLTQNPGW